MIRGEIVEIKSRDYWFKIVEFLQQNWALIDQQDSIRALKRNGFKRFADDTETQEFIAQPEPPFSRRPHPNGLIYSSGRYWK